MEAAETNKGGKGKKSFIWVGGMVVVAAISFLGGMFIFRSIGYDEGVRFAVSSGSKQGYSLGFEMGYQFRDSIAKSEKARSASSEFNLNLSERETDDPQSNIVAAGNVLLKETGNGISAKHVIVKLVSTAQFARYKDIKVSVTYLDRRANRLKEQDIALEDILYPGRNVIYEILPKEIPDLTESVEVKLVSAEGID